MNTYLLNDLVRDDMITAEELHKRLVEEIKYNKISRKKIARILGVSLNTVSAYICGRRTPSLVAFANLCKAFDLDAEYILFDV